ncbi:MAG: hypothetical protein QOE31_1664 [Solirubrobacteraceae bacterium]|nr:hypothetical protein [Solirubrobacteraceae bacterium]
MRSDGRENVLGAPVALPRRALADSAAGKALEALTLASLVLLVPRALGAADYGRFAVALAIATAPGRCRRMRGMCRARAAQPKLLDTCPALSDPAAGG